MMHSGGSSNLRQFSIVGAIFVFAGLWSAPGFAQTTNQRSTDERIQALERKLEELDQRVRASDRNRELKEAEFVEKSKSDAGVKADTTGFTIKSADDNFTLHIGADLQVDSRTFYGDGATGTTDQLLLRRIRPTFYGTVYKYVDFYIRPDFGLGQTLVYEAFLQLNYFSPARLRVGKFKPPVGLERLQSDDDTTFVERGLPTNLVPSRDIGYQLMGDLVKRRLGYQVGMFNGVPDNGIGSDISPTGHREFAARIFATPFEPNEGFLRGLGFGAAGSGGSDDNVPLPSYKTVGQNNFMFYNSGVSLSGRRTRWTPQAFYYLGPFGVFSEYVRTDEGMQKGNVRHNIGYRSWQVAASYILTGENKSYFSPTPRKSFDPLHGGWGAVEIAARLGDFTADPGLFKYGFADPTKSARRLHEWVGGVNWYLNRLVRLSLDYGSTSFAGGAKNGDRPEEKVIISRFQINFI
jgi:phosphate-selective porin OprO/OprP